VKPLRLFRNFSLSVFVSIFDRTIMTFLDKYSNDINKLCKHHKVKRLYAFGSVLTNRFSKLSDVDLIVDFDKIDVDQYADNYFDFKFSLQEILKHPIDLLEEKAIKNPYLKKAISQKRQLVYGY
jgi:predicted nucleotidyltransferase